MRKLTAAEVTFSVEIEADENCSETEIRGSFATDEPDMDRETADEIIRRLRRGEVEAWCGVVVTASWEHDGETYVGRDSLWHCSLNDDYTAEVVAEHHDMREEALDDLNRTLEAECARVSSLARALAPVERVQLSPHLDLWMRGARYGEVVKRTRLYTHVRLDATGRVVKLAHCDVTPC